MKWPLSFGRRAEQRLATKLYADVIRQARQKELYLEARVPDTLDGRFEMAMLHMFLVLRRLKGEGEKAKDLSQRLFDTFFADMDAVLREDGVGDLAVGKRIRKLAEQFYGRVDAYEAGLKGAGDELRQALERNVYEAETAAGADMLAAYVRRQAASIMAAPLTELFDGRIAFLPFDAAISEPATA